MRRKIEKYLAKKQNCDESQIRYTEDGRFDFMGDLEGILAAVRGKDKSGRSRKSSTSTPGSLASKGKDLNSSFLSVSTTSPLSSGGTNTSRKRGKKYGEDTDEDGRRRFSDLYDSRYDEENKENLVGKENMKSADHMFGPYDSDRMFGKPREMPYDYDRRKSDSYRLDYDDRRGTSSYPVYTMRRGANQGPYTEAIQKGSTSSNNIFSFSPSKRDKRDRSQEHRENQNEKESNLMSPEFGMDFTPGGATRDRSDRYPSRISSLHDSHMSYHSSSRMETPEPKSRWTEDSEVPQSAATWRSPHKSVMSSNAHGLTPLSNIKGSYFNTPMGEDFRSFFSPDALSSTAKTPRDYESSGISGQNIFSPSWNASSDARNTKMKGETNKKLFDDRTSSKSDPTAHDRPKICVSQLRIGDDNENIKSKQQPLSDAKFRQVAISPISHFNSGRRVSGELNKTSSRYFHHDENNTSIAKDHPVTSIRSDLRCEENPESNKSEADFPSKSTMNDSSRDSLTETAHRNSNISKDEQTSKSVAPTPITKDIRDASMEGSLGTSESLPKLDMSSLLSPNPGTSKPSPYPSGGILSGLPTPTTGSSADKFWGKEIDLGFSPEDMYSPKSRSSSMKVRSSSMSPGPGSENFIDSLISVAPSPKRRRLRAGEDANNRSSPLSSSEN